MKTDISIIVPIYKGKKYILYWLEKAANNAAYLTPFDLRCELILVNDFPEETIAGGEFQTTGFDLKVLNSKKNRGIHGARVYGLEHAEGEWVIFLDQDDQITDDYLIKQKKCIGDAAAAVCNGYVTHFCKDIRNYIYANSNIQKRVQDLTYYISTGNPIYSPGQVMLKKESIPDFWCRHIIKTNGADDYLLWILMLKEGYQFVINEEKLYTHIGHADNISNDITSMVASIHEIEQLLEDNGFLDDREKEIIRNRNMQGVNIHRSVDIIATYDYWLYLEHRHQSIAEFLQEHGYFKIGIYGMGSLGNRLYDLLYDSDVKVVFAMDRRANDLECEIPIFCLEDERIKRYIKNVDAIIVTAASAFQAIKEEVENKYGALVLSLKNILLEIIKSIQ